MTRWELAEKYGAQPTAIETVNVFGYQEELPRRAAEYGSLRSLPIQFRPDELGAEHWEFLMKPPTREAEYDDDCTDSLMRVPQALEVRPRCTMHVGSTIRQGDESRQNTKDESENEPDLDYEELEAELCPVCGAELVLRRSRSGPMMVCNTYPNCRYARKA